MLSLVKHRTIYCGCRTFLVYSRLSHDYHQRSAHTAARTFRDLAELVDLTANKDDYDVPRMIEVVGHIRTVRNQKRRSFIKLGDGSTIRQIQAVLEPPQAKGLGVGTAVSISGLWSPSPGPEQSHELVAQRVEIIGVSDAETYPVQKKHLTLEYLRTIPHLRIRTGLAGLLTRLRSDCEFSIASFFREQRFVHVRTPAITSSDCEGAGEVFEVAPQSQERKPLPDADNRDDGNIGLFFRKPKYLTVSSQLHLEAFVHEHPRVWTLSPTFRAERSDTSRHLSEFYMLEVELRCQTLDEVMDVVEALVRKVATDVASSVVGSELLAIETDREVLEDKLKHQWRQQQQQQRDGLGSGSGHITSMTAEKKVDLSKRWEGLRKSFWPRLSYDQAIKLLIAEASASPSLFDHQPSWEKGLQVEHEKFLAEHIGQGGPVFITDYPKALKPFYMLPSSEGMRTQMPAVEIHPPQGVLHQGTASSASSITSPSISTTATAASPISKTPELPSTAACFDLILPDVCEVAGGSLREHRLEALIKSMQQHGLRNNADDDNLVSNSRYSSNNNDDNNKRQIMTVPEDNETRSNDLDWYVELRRYGSVPHGGFGLGLDRLLAYVAGVDSVRDVVPWPRYYGRCDG